MRIVIHTASGAPPLQGAANERAVQTMYTKSQMRRINIQQGRAPNDGLESRCANCVHSRTIVSENGFHASCLLSRKKVAECVAGTRDHFNNDLSAFVYERKGGADDER